MVVFVGLGQGLCCAGHFFACSTPGDKTHLQKGTVATLAAVRGSGNEEGYPVVVVTQC